MGKSKLAIVTLIIAIIFTSSLTYMTIYYNGKIAALNDQISNLKEQVSRLTNLTSANLKTALNITHAQAYTTDLMRVVKTYLPFNCLSIQGSVINTGEGTAFYAGLQVIGDSNGEIKVNMTVPLVDGGFYGTDNTTSAFVSGWGNSPTQLGSLVSGQTAKVTLGIYYAYSITNWTVTPIWTDTPQ